MINIVLHGAMGKAVGRSRWRLAVKTPAEALRLIEANTRKLYKYLAGSGAETPYRIKMDNRELKSLEEVSLPCLSSKTIHFIPLAAGAGSGKTGGILIAVGVILLAVALSIILPGIGSGLGLVLVQAGLSTLAVSTIAGLALSVGLSLTLAGISTLIAKSPSTTQGASDASYLLNGAVNTINQGGPVPVAYGLVIIGSQTISAGVRSTDIPLPT